MCIFIILTTICGIVFSYLNVKTVYVGKNGTTNSAAANAGTIGTPYARIDLAISSTSVSTGSAPDLLKILVLSGDISGSMTVSTKTTVTADYEIIGSIKGEMITEKAKMEESVVADSKFDLDCVFSQFGGSWHRFGGTGELMTIVRSQTVSVRRMGLELQNSNGTLFRIGLGHLICRKVYFQGAGRAVAIEYQYGSLSLFRCYFLGANKTGSGFITATGGQNVYIYQCRFVNGTSTDTLSPVYFNSVANLTVYDCVFTYCYAANANGIGGGMFIGNPKRVVLLSTSFENCTATTYGGGLAITNVVCDDFDMVFSSVVLVTNEAKNKWGNQLYIEFVWDMCRLQLSASMYKKFTQGFDLYAVDKTGSIPLDTYLYLNANASALPFGVIPDGVCDPNYEDPVRDHTPKPPKKPIDNTTAEAGRQLSNILLVFLIIITIVVIVIGILVCIYLVVTMIQGLNKPARVATKDLSETEAEAYYNQMDGYEIEQVAHDEDGVTIIGEEEHIKKGGSKWAKKWAAIAKRAKKKDKFGVEAVDEDRDGPNPDDLASSLTQTTKKRSMKKEKSGWSSGYSEYDSGYSGYSGSGYSGSGYSGSGAYSGYSGSGASGSGYSGSGYSGYSGSGYSGSGASGSDASGYSGSGASGYSGSGAYSGYSGSGASGSDASGYSGSGASGYSGSGAYSGYSGSGASGSNPDASGYSGAGGSGASGYSGKGSSGYSGAGTSGYSGAGTSGYSGKGASGYSGAGGSGYSGSDASSGGGSGSGMYSGYSGGGGDASGYSGSGAGSKSGASKSKRSSSKHSKTSKSKSSKRSASPSSSASRGSSASKSKRSKATKSKKSHK